MNLSEFQGVIAELSMALAGFSGLSIGIKRTRQNRVDPRDKFGPLLIADEWNRYAVFTASGVGVAQFFTFLVLTWSSQRWSSLRRTLGHRSRSIESS